MFRNIDDINDIRHVGQVCGGWDLTGRQYHFLLVLQHEKSWKSFGKVEDSRRGAKDAKDGVS